MWTKMYMRIRTRDHGDIEGDCTQEGRQKLIWCLGVNHDVALPRPRMGVMTPSDLVPGDARASLSSGHPSSGGHAPSHHPLTVTTLLGAHTPRVLEACCSAEPLDVEIGMYRINRMGEEEAFPTVKLKEAAIVDNRVRFLTTSIEENKAGEHVQDISFAYKTITWTYEPGKSSGVPTHPLEAELSWHNA